MVDVIIKTSRGFEKIVASHILEVFPNVEVIPAPKGFKGIVFVKGGDPHRLFNTLRNKIPEIEKILPIYASCSSNIEEISETAYKVVKEKLYPHDSFAVRTTRRGEHDFTSIDVNIAVGAKIKEELGNPVNLDYPDKVIWIEIFHEDTYISITEEQVVKKPRRDNILPLLKKISFVQMPYLGDLEGAYRMGVRIGRAAQAFEIRELIIAPHTIVDAYELERFLTGVMEGRMSRYEIQKKSYPRKVELVPVRVYDLFQLARSRLGEVFIVTSARGERINERLCEEIVNLLKREKRITIFAGAREGIPIGIMRWAKITLNITPGITFATEHTIPATISTILTCYQLMCHGKEKC